MLTRHTELLNQDMSFDDVQAGLQVEAMTSDGAFLVMMPNLSGDVAAQPPHMPVHVISQQQQQQQSLEQQLILEGFDASNLATQQTSNAPFMDFHLGVTIGQGGFRDIQEPQREESKFSKLSKNT